MASNLQADIGFLNVTTGIQKSIQPPGFLVGDAPRSAARGRGRDTLLIRLHIHDNVTSQVNTLTSLLQLASGRFFGTSGSLTSAAREAIGIVNTKLLEDTSSYPHIDAPRQPGITCAVLRGSELYLVQTGPGTAFTLHHNSTQQFPDPDRQLRPLGKMNNPEIHYFHTRLMEGDWLILCNEQPAGWKAEVLRNIDRSDETSALHTLIEKTGNETQALICRFVPKGSTGKVTTVLTNMISTLQSEGPELSPHTDIETTSRPSADELFDILEQSQVTHQIDNKTTAIPQPPEEPIEEHVYADGHLFDEIPVTPDRLPQTDISNSPQPSQAPSSTVLSEFTKDPTDPESSSISGLWTKRARRLSPATAVGRWLPSAATWFVKLPLRSMRSKIDLSMSSLQTSLFQSLHKSITRLLPNSTNVISNGRRSGHLLFMTAVAVPIVVVSIVTLMYMQLGRSKQFELYLEGARQEMTSARTASDTEAAEPHWYAAIDWLNKAELVHPNHNDSDTLRKEARRELDVIHNIVRLEVKNLVSDGLPRSAKITRLLSHGTNLYGLDFANQKIYRVVMTTAGEYQIDHAFHCGKGPVASYTISDIVDIAWLDTRSIVGQDTLLGFDQSGKLIYCPSDNSPPAVTVLTPPEDGWINPISMEIYADRLYVLDPDANEIWIYRGAAQSFGGTPERYIGDQKLDITDTFDFAIAQRDIFIIHSDGRITHCTRQHPAESPECTVGAQYTDLRPHHPSGERLKDLDNPVNILYDPPPEPSLYVADAISGGTFQISLGLVLQRQIRPELEHSEPVGAIAIGPSRNYYFAIGNQIYVSQNQ